MMKIKSNSDYSKKVAPLMALMLGIMLAFYSCELPGEPIKNCNESLKISENTIPIEFSHSFDSESFSIDEKMVSSFFSWSSSLENICPEQYLRGSFTLYLKSNTFEENLLNVKLFWHYTPWLIDYKDYNYLLQNPDNPFEWTGSAHLLPTNLGFQADYPARLRFSIEIYLLNPTHQDEALSWFNNNISSCKFEFEGTRF